MQEAAARRSIGKVERKGGKAPLFALVVVVTNALGNFFIARGMRGLPERIQSPFELIAALFTPWVALGVVLLITWLLSRMAFLSFADLSFVLPVTSLGYVASALMGHFFLGELITPKRWLGTALICAGAILVGLHSHRASKSVAQRAAE